MIYLIQYDRSTGNLVRLQEFPSARKKTAEEARLCVELELLGTRISQEVVLLEATSEEELRKTHRRYFERLEQLLTEAPVATP